MPQAHASGQIRPEATLGESPEVAARSLGSLLAEFVMAGGGRTEAEDRKQEISGRIHE